MLNILAIGRDAAILEVLERLINSHEGWKATVTTSDEEGVRLVKEGTTLGRPSDDGEPAESDWGEGFRIVFVCAGVTFGEEEALRARIGAIDPEIVVTRHYGGGSGLLENEVLAIINSKR